MIKQNDRKGAGLIFLYIYIEKIYIFLSETKFKLVQNFMAVLIICMKSQSSGQHFPTFSSKTGKSHAISSKLAKIELVRDFMHVPVICKVDQDWIKSGRYRPNNIFPLYVYEIL